MTSSNHRNTRIFAENKDDEICISGVSGIFPNARNVHILEHKLYNKVGTLLHDTEFSHMISKYNFGSQSRIQTNSDSNAIY